MRSVAVHVVCRKASIIVGKASFSQSCAYTSYYKIHLLCFAFSAQILIASETSIPMVLFNKGKARHSTTTYCEAVYRLVRYSPTRLAKGCVLLLLSKVTQRHFRHSASKVHCALPRAQHGICPPIPCWCSLILSRTQRIARARNTLFMWTISSLARIFPYATSIEFLVATASATSFLSSAVMYLWGQLLRTRMVICMCRANTPSFGRQ